MNKRERIVSRTQLATENPLEGEQLFLDAMFGVSGGGLLQDSVVDRDEAGMLGNRSAVGVGTTEETVGSGPPRESKVRGPGRRAAVKPQHYKIVSISLYNEDIERLNTMVRELKRRGHYKANKSQLIRYALARLDVDQIPKEM